MKANELRVGNLVGSYNKGEEDRVLTINAQNILVEAKANKQGYTRYRPIPLTEEWLLKFGFENNRLGLFDCIKVVEDIGFHIYFIQRHLKEVQYVHQLQNLYFALVGEELKLKEDESKID